MALPILAIGGAVVDRTYLCANPPSLATSNPVTSHRGLGGVARNVCESLARLGARTRLITAIGDDGGGRAISESLAAAGVDMRSLLTLCGSSTAEYTAAFWQGELFAGFADMGIFEALTPDAVAERLPRDLAGWLVFADCNLPAATLAMLAARAASGPFPLVIDCVSLAKSERLPKSLAGVSLLTLNGDQARQVAGIEALPQAVAAILARGCERVTLTLGANGLIAYEGGAKTEFAAPKVPVVSVSGAGDALIAGTLLGLSEGGSLSASILFGLAATELTLQSIESVPPGLNRALLEATMKQRQTISGEPDAH